MIDECTIWEGFKANLKLLSVIIFGVPIVIIWGVIVAHIWQGLLNERRRFFWKRLGVNLEMKTRRFTAESQKALKKVLDFMSTGQPNCAELAREITERGERWHRKGLLKWLRIHSPWERARHEMIINAREGVRLTKQAIATRHVVKNIKQLSDLAELHLELREMNRCCRKCLQHNKYLEKKSGHTFTHECLIERRSIFERK